MSNKISNQEYHTRDLKTKVELKAIKHGSKNILQNKEVLLENKMSGILQA